MLNKHDDKVIELLTNFEIRTGCHILIAVAAGPRVWDIPTPRGKFEILCVFSGGRRPKSIDMQSTGDCQDATMPKHFDIGTMQATVSGHDVTSFASLCSHSNHTAIDLIQSPVVFVERPGFRLAIEEIVARRSPADLAHGYVDRLYNLQRRLLGPQAVPTSMDYLEAIRLALCVYWLEDNPEGLPPLSLISLIGDVDLEQDLIDSISQEIVHCGPTGDLTDRRRNPVLDRFLLRAVHETAQIAPMLRHAIVRPSEVCELINDIWPQVMESEFRVAIAS